MKLASSSYYYEPLADLDIQERSEAELRNLIERLQRDFPGYGYRRLGRQLRREGIVVNDKRIRRVQNKYQLFPIRWRTFKTATTDSNHSHKIYPNLLAHKTLTGINQAWVAESPTSGSSRGLFSWPPSWIATRARSSVGRSPNGSMPSCVWRH
jgi:putative transposase